jgi:hypothetical protein
MNRKLSPFFIIKEPFVNESYRLLYSTGTGPNPWQEQIFPGPSGKIYQQKRLGLNSYYSWLTSTLPGVYRPHTRLKYLQGNEVPCQE